MESKSNRMRRLLAFLIDLMLSYLPCVLSTAILQFSFLGNVAILIILIAVVTFFVTFILRDYLFNGRSIGKRIFKLKIVDADTRSKPAAKQLVVKNLFLFLYLFDGLFLIASGRSLGERATRTIVLHEQQLPCSDPLLDSVQLVSQKKETTTKKRLIVAATTVLCVSIPMFLIISTALDAAKEQENYQIAYSYLVDSDAYAEMQVDESQITLTGYSSSTRIDNDGDTTSTVVTFTFLVRGQQYQVVCHQDGEMWYACNDCTEFQ
jgi:uncharacterized RDD family membrane protein YckC